MDQIHSRYRGTRAMILVIYQSPSLVTELEDDNEESSKTAAGFSTHSTDVFRIFPYISIFENLSTQDWTISTDKKNK